MTMANLESDLNNTIMTAVTARVEAEVVKALSGHELIGRYVAAALNQQVEVGGSFSRTKTTFLHQALRTAFQEMTKKVINELLVDERPLIEDEIRKAIRRNATKFAEAITGNIVTRAANAYGIQVQVRLPGDES
jgi:hypothetical protein